MTADLTDWVVDRIIESGVDDEIGYLVLAALDGDDSWHQYLSDGTRTRELIGSDEKARSASRAVGGTFLSSIEVEGFRGVGSKVTLELEARPGLTVIAGRNGSGKSSLAEALELTLTGSTYRWKNRTAPWRQHWRNLHHDGQSSITVKVSEEGVDKLTTIHTEWAAGATDVDDREVWTQVHGQRKQDLAALGWDGPLETFRPLLSYDELGGLLVEGQAPLYDALATVLGVEQLTDALKRIGDQVKELKAPQTRLNAERRSLQASAADLDDERAATAAVLLKKTAPDVGAVRAVVTGVARVDSGPIAALRMLGSLTAPLPDEVKHASEALRAAVEAMARAGEEVSRRELDRLQLRQRALAVHAEHGDMPCPVCSSATLDAGWAERSKAQIAESEAGLAELKHARQDLELARSRARAFVTSLPSALDRAPVSDVEDPMSLARSAWTDWADAPPDDLRFAEHLELHVNDLCQALEGLRQSAHDAVNARDDIWSPVATRIAAWCDDHAGVVEAAPRLVLLAAAEKWLKEIDARAKNERLAPIIDDARDAWTKLRQESNVDMVGLELTGSKTSRRVAISATVDGVEASALPVMSQGELHALALALFLPRASMAQSPFRFLVIDDPVQAMDPAKVDGLVELLSGLAQTHQVIVLSHDDRLPAAVRRSRVGAYLFEVRRGVSSAVEIVKSEDPATRYLSDAFAVLSDTDLPAETARRALPGLLRMAVESAARERWFGSRLREGTTLAEVERVWDDAKKTANRVSLAIYGETRPLDSWLGPLYRKEGLGVVSSGFHGGMRERSDLKGVARSVERMVDDIRNGAK